MAHLTLLLLGTPEIRHAGQLAAFPTRKTLALLTYLAVAGGLHSREKLTALFWPESDAERGRTVLRRTLAYLREALRAGDHFASTSHLIVERDALGFDPTDSESDLAVVQIAWKRVRLLSPTAAELTEDRSNVIAQLHDAAQRYRGDFLDGFNLSDAPGFDEWAAVQREVWHRRMSLILDRLSEAQLEGGDVPGALETTARWIAHYPLNEAAHRRRIMVHLTNGDRPAALQAYTACQALLAHELNAELAPETIALLERIQDGRAGSAPHPRIASPTDFSVHSPLIGRLNEHTRLVTCYTAAGRGQTQAVVLEGAPGLGKTRLAQEFSRWAVVHNALLLRGQAIATGRQLLYQPLTEALRACLSNKRELRALLSDVWLAELSWLLPELRDYFPDLQSPMLGEAEVRPRLFEAITQLVEAFARQQPVVLFIDDLQWADAASLDCLLYASRRWSVNATPVLMLFTMRVAEGATSADDRSGALNWLTSLGRAVPLTRLQIGPLHPRDALKLVQAFLPTAADEHIGNWLAAESGGHPQVIIETLAALAERGYLHQREGGGWELIGLRPPKGAEADANAGIPSEVHGLLRAQTAALQTRAAPAPGASVRRHGANLPASPTSLIGREQDVAALRRSLTNKAIRLLTLVGPPGIGKTRLALQVAEASFEDFEDGVWFVALAAIQDPALVAATIAQALDIKEPREQPPMARLRNALRDRHTLLVLDNFEQVLGAANVVAELLAAAPWLNILITSRSVLHIYGEHEYTVLPLASPNMSRLPGLEELAQVAAVQLFTQRAQAVKSDFSLTRANADAVAEICTRLEGVPLAIELAAAWIRSLAPHALLMRLNDRLKLLTGGPRDLPARQQTLRGAISWSFDLLSEEEQLVFARLGVFVGGWSAKAAEAVSEEREPGVGSSQAGAAAPPPSAQPASPILAWLASLVHKSLVRHENGPQGEPRYTMLQAIREFALERLAAQRAIEQTRRRHASYYLGLAEQIEPDLGGPQQAVLLQVLECEHDNLREALSLALEYGDAELGLRLCVALWWFWFVRGYLSEGRHWLELVLAKFGMSGVSDEQALLRAKVLNAAGVLAHDQGDYDQATIQHEQSLALVRALGRTGGIAASLNNLGLVARSQGDYERAATYYAESLALRREQGDEWSMAVALSNLGLVASDQGQYERAVARYEESLALRQKLGDKRGIAILLNQLGVAEYHQRNYSRAATLHEESLTLQSELTDKAGAADSFYGLAKVASAQGNQAQAYEFYTESLVLRRELGDRAGIAACLEGIATVVEKSGRSQQAARLLGAAQALRDAIGASLSPIDLSDCEQTIAAVRASLGERAYTTAWVEGQAMSHEQVVAYALDRGHGWL